jgi:hypothetical protein
VGIFLRAPLHCVPASQNQTPACWEQLRASLRRKEKFFFQRFTARLRSPRSLRFEIGKPRPLTTEDTEERRGRKSKDHLFNPLFLLPEMHIPAVQPW